MHTRAIAALLIYVLSIGLLGLSTPLPTHHATMLYFAGVCMGSAFCELVEYALQILQESRRKQ